MILDISRTSEACRLVSSRQIDARGVLAALLLASTLGLLGTIVGSPRIAAAADMVPIALSNTQAPGLQSGIDFNVFQFDIAWSIAPTIGPGGEVAFYAAAAPATPYPGWHTGDLARQPERRFSGGIRRRPCWRLSSRRQQ